MNLREKLKQIDSFTNQIARPGQVVFNRDIAEHIDGRYEETPFGLCFVIEKSIKYNHLHGSMKIQDPDQIESNIFHLIGKDDRLKGMNLRETLFFDTETTGLSSGTGTHIFLAGFGYFVENGFNIRQYFLRDFDEEKAFLYAINELLKKFTSIVSYNGKSFDWPQMQTRFIYSRMKCKLNTPLHLDLVHTVRRIWKQRLGDCSLQNIEQHIIKFHREDDIPGALIPQVFFQYLRDKNSKPLIPIFHHNRMDIISMVALLFHVYHIYRSPFQYLSDTEDLISLSRTYTNLKNWEESRKIYEYLLHTVKDKKHKDYITYQLSFCYKRLGCWKQAIRLWEDIISNGCPGIEPYIELAKYYEHISCNYKRAIHYVQQAFNFVEIQEQLHGITDFHIFKDELVYRQKRINRKIMNNDTD